MISILKRIYNALQANHLAEDTLAAAALTVLIGGVVFCTVHPSEAMRIGSNLLTACLMAGRWCVGNPEKIAALYAWLLKAKGEAGK